MYLQIDEILLSELLLAVISQIGIFPFIQLNINHRQIDILAILSELPAFLPFCSFFLPGVVHLLSEVIIYPKSLIAY